MAKETYWSADDVMDQLQAAFNNGENFSITQAAQVMGCSKELANARLNALARKEMLLRPSQGWYCLNEEEDRALLIFRLDDSDSEHREWVKSVMERKAARLRMSQWQQRHASRS